MKNLPCKHRLSICIVVVVASILSRPALAQVRNALPDDTRKLDLTDIIKNLVTSDETKKKEKKDKIVKVKQQNKKVYLSFIPVSTRKRGAKNVYVSSVSSAFYLGKADSTYLSHVSLEPATNFSNKFGIGYRFNLWTHHNRWNIPGEVTITNLDQFTWGLGSTTVDAMKYKIATKYIKFHANLNRNFRHSQVFFYGMGINYDRYYNLVSSITTTDPAYLEKYVITSDESLYSLGYNATLLYDTRRNSVNPSKGMYAAVVFRNNPAMLGNSYLWTSLYLDFRKYIPLTNLNTDRRGILALWAMYWGSYGNVPYLNMPSTSNDLNGQSGRGFNFARFRGREMLYFESEYRFDIAKNGLLGGVVFSNVQCFTEPDTNQFAYPLPAAGVGARIKINKKSNTNLGLDFAFAKDGFNFSAVLGEAF